MRTLLKSMRMKRIIAIVLAAAIGGCEPRQPEAQGGGASPSFVRVAVLAESKDDPTWPVAVMTARRFADQHARVSIEVVAPDVPSPKRQKEMLGDFGDGRCDVVCVYPTDPAALRTSIDELVRSGTPVVTFGRDVRASSRMVYCGPHEEDLGRAAFEACLPHLPGHEAMVMLLAPAEDDPQYGRRVQTFRHLIGTLRSADFVRVVAPGQDAWDTATRIREEARRYPRAACWVFMDDWPFQTATPPDRLVPDRCAVVMCSGSREHFDRLRSGVVAALVTYDFQQATEAALLAAIQIASQPGTRVPGVDVAVEIVTARNVKEHARRWVLWERGEPTPGEGR